MSREQELNFQGIAKDLMKLCKKHKIRIVASNEDFVGIGPADLERVGEYKVDRFEVTPHGASLQGPEINLKFPSGGEQNPRKPGSTPGGITMSALNEYLVH